MRVAAKTELPTNLMNPFANVQLSLQGELVVALARRDDDDVILRAMKVGLNIEGVSRDLQLALSYILFDTRMVSKKSGTFRLRH